MLKKITGIVLIVFVLIASYLTLNEEVYYQEYPIYDTGMDAAGENGPICSANLSGIKNQASIMPAKGEKVEIITVKKSENVGIDVVYRIVKQPDPSANPEGGKVEFYNLFGLPVGFKMEK